MWNLLLQPQTKIVLYKKGLIISVSAWKTIKVIVLFTFMLKINITPIYLLKPFVLVKQTGVAVLKILSCNLKKRWKIKKWSHYSLTLGKDEEKCVSNKPILKMNYFNKKERRQKKRLKLNRIWKYMKEKILLMFLSFIQKYLKQNNFNNFEKISWVV